MVRVDGVRSFAALVSLRLETPDAVLMGREPST